MKTAFMITSALALMIGFSVPGASVAFAQVGYGQADLSHRPPEAPAIMLPFEPQPLSELTGRKNGMDVYVPKVEFCDIACVVPIPRGIGR